MMIEAMVHKPVDVFGSATVAKQAVRQSAGERAKITEPIQVDVRIRSHNNGSFAVMAPGVVLQHSGLLAAGTFLDCYV